MLKPKMRLIYWLSVTLLLVFIILPIFFFFYLFNEDEVKQMLLNQIDSSYKLTINGQIKPKFWHGLSLDIKNITLSTSNNISLVHINSIGCKLSWLDLILGRYKVKRISINGVDLYGKNLKVYGFNNLLNIHNFNSSFFSNLNTLDIYKINTIKDDNFPYLINNGSIELEELSNFKLSLPIQKDKNKIFILATGILEPKSPNNLQFSNLAIDIYSKNLSTSLIADGSYNINDTNLHLKELTGNVLLNNYSGEININQINLSSKNFSADNGNISLRYNNNLTNSKLNISFKGLTTSSYKSILFNQLTAKYDTNYITLNSLFNNIIIDNNLHIISNDCRNDISLSIPNFTQKINIKARGTCEYTSLINLINLNLLGNLDDTPIKLQLKIFNYEKPYIIANGNIESLTIATISTSKDPLYFDNSLLPFNWLSLFDIKADLAIHHLVLDRINLFNVVTKLNLINSKLNINSLQADLYNGVLVGNAQIIKYNNFYNFQSQANIMNLNMESLFNNLFNVKAIKGIAHVNLNISANKINSYSDLHKKLNGQIILNATKGEFSGLDLSLFSNSKKMQNKSTSFEQLIAKFNFLNGISANSVMFFYSPFIIARGDGKIDFVNTLIDYNLVIKSFLPNNSQKINSVLIPLKINSDLFNPKITIQNIHLVIDKAKGKKIKKK